MTDRVVDHRFADLIEEILRRKWLVLTQLDQYEVAEALGVTRTTIWAWASGTNGISRETAENNKDRPGVAGYFARRVLEIHADNERWQIKRNLQLFEKWYRELVDDSV